MAFKCTICSYLDIESDTKPTACISCGTSDSMIETEYQKPISNEDTNTNQQESEQPSEDESLGSVFPS